jgi:hypothetical protein
MIVIESLLFVYEICVYTKSYTNQTTEYFIPFLQGKSLNDIFGNVVKVLQVASAKPLAHLGLFGWLLSQMYYSEHPTVLCSKINQSCCAVA